MDIANIPSFTAVPFASGATGSYRNTVPQSASSTPGAASYETGFVPANFEPIASGGIPPFGGDFNGVFFDITTRMQYEQAGGNYPFNAAFSTAIGGYPKGAIVLRSDSNGQWLSTTDNNTTDPDSSSAAGWIALRANTGSASVSTTGGTVAPTPTQLGAQVLIVAGTLTSNAVLRLPLTAGAQWTVVNNTTGSFTLTVAGTTGTGASVTQGAGIIAYTDGTNYYAISAAVSGSYLPIDGTAVAATKLATARNFSITGGVTASAASFDGTGNVVLNVSAIPGNAATSSKWASAVTLSLTGIATGSSNIDGSGNVTLNTSIADAALSIAKTNGLQSALDAKASLNAAVSFSTITVATFPYFYGGGSYGSGLIIRTGSGSGVPYKYFTFNDTGSFDAASATFSGAVTASGGFQNSDRRLKKDVMPRKVQRGLALKLARMFCEWDRIADGVHDVGLIAQRVKALASRYVIRGEGRGRKAGILAIDKAGIALEASMDNALHLNEHDKSLRELQRRIARLEKAR